MVCRKLALSLGVVTVFLFAPGMPRAQQPAQSSASESPSVSFDEKSIGGDCHQPFRPGGRGLGDR
jgi:hypothetical protein